MKLFYSGSDDLKEALKNMKCRDEKATKNIEISVLNILNEIKEDGDKALIKYERQFDFKDYDKESIRVKISEIDEAISKVEPSFIEAFTKAKENIERYHREQIKKSYYLSGNKGVLMGQLIKPLESAGIYVPNGTASYPSSVLMNTVPAKIAGVKRIAIGTPPSRDGKINPYILAAAKLLGIDEIYKMGGAQAIGALAYGTDTIKEVDIITGPGNIYVATAKKMVFGRCKIDMVAGPSEILVIADSSAKASFAAADLLSQAEHDVLASAILVTTSKELANSVLDEINIQVEKLSRKEIIKESLLNYGLIIIAKDINEAIKISNDIAPEHLELMIEDPFRYLKDVVNAGSIFLGCYTPEPVGDYFGGPNHILPTMGTARFSSPLTVDDFTKKSSFLYYTKDAIKDSGKYIEELANIEGLTAHRNSITVRLDE